MMRFWAAILVLMIGLAAISCERPSAYYSGPGLSPRYIPESELGNIYNMPPQNVENAGVIYLLNDWLFMVEQKKGIHVFEVSDTSNPVNLTFIRIPAVNDFTINGNTLFADNGPNIVSIDITDIFHVQVLATIPNSFQPYLFPPLYNGPFECADPEKGVVIEWVDTMLVDARCQVN